MNKNKFSPKKLVLIAILSALTVAGRIVFAPFPFIKPTMALIIISGISLGGITGFLVGAISAFVSNFYFGHGLWTIFQMLSYGIVGLIAGIMSNIKLFKKSVIIQTIFSFLATFLIYGAIMNISSLFMMTPNAGIKDIISYCMASAPFDFTHSASTAVFLFITAKHIGMILDRIKNKYDL